MIASLSQTDVERLMADPSDANRAEAAAKVALQFDSRSLTPKERELAEQIVRIMVRDAAQRVREALAHNLKNSDSLPHDVAMMLARDVESVALPILESSAVLTDDDLMEIVRAANPTKQTAIAGRPRLAAAVADTLIDSGNVKAVTRLVANDTAALSERALETVLDRYGKDETIQDSMAHRAELPIMIAERLVATVSDNLRDYLVAHHDLPAGTATDLLMESRERATVGLLPPGAKGVDIMDLVRQMMASGRLTPSIILRALCMGDLAFFEASLSALTKIPLVSTRILILDEGALGFKALYDKAGLPAPMFPAFRIAVDVARQTDFDGGENDRERHMSRMIQRILTQYEDVGQENLDYLLRKLNQIAA
jgi:uncharacterized protein (DUF2336 family)